MNIPILVLVAGLAVSVPAQQASLVVPLELQDVEGPTLRRVAGFAATVRQQVIIAADHLKPLVGKAINGLSFRRDRRLNMLYEGGWVGLSVSLSTSDSSPANPSHVMQENVGRDATEVFSGNILLPGSPAMNSEVPPWDPMCTATISFSVPFQYWGGNLCVELKPLFGLATSDILRWPVDAASSLLHGSSATVSASCSSVPGAPTTFGSSNSFVDPHELVIGRSVTFKARGTPRGIAIFLLGPKQDPAFDLSVLGSPGCFVHVQPSAKVYLTAFTAPITDSAPEFGGRANATLQIPFNTSLLGAEFYCQWVDMGPPIMTSNTLRVTFASDMPTLGMSIVSAPYENSTVPEVGHVSIDVGHVMRFDYR